MRSLSRPEGCVSDLAFDELHAGELEASARSELEAHIAGCARCRDRREALNRERTALLAQAPDLAALAPAPRPKATPPMLWLSGAVAAAAAAAMLVLGPGAEPPSEPTRSKGAPSLGIVIKRHEQTFRAETGAHVRAGDLVRFTYSSDRARHLAILGLDARVAQVYYPTQLGADSRAARVPAASDSALDFSVELDATPGDEQIFGLFCDEPVALEAARAELERKRAAPSLAGCEIDRIVLHKEPTR